MLKTALTLAFLAALPPSPQAVAETTVALDLLLRGGTVYTGDSQVPMVGDVGIVGDRIVFAGKALPAQFSARRTIDVTGMVVAPGFIDAHTHADVDLFSNDPHKRLNIPFVTQGVTTAVIGNDGFGGFDIAAQAQRLRTAPIGTNVAMYVGFGPVRIDQLGEANRAPTPEQLEVMKRNVGRAMCGGALGLSTGLFYPPQNYSNTEEVIELAKVAARHGGIYDSHIRDESIYNIGLKASIEEVIRIGHEAGLPVHVAHIKALGIDVQGQSSYIVRRIEQARRGGLDITADQYPWNASSTRFSAALVPPWAVDGGRSAMLQRFDDPALRQRLRTDMRENLRLRGGAEAILFTAGKPKYVGKTLDDVSKASNTDPVEAAIAVLREADLQIASFNQSDDDIRVFMKRPWVMTSSDSSPGHPRAYGTFAQKYAQYVVKERVISIAQFINGSSALTADTLGLVRRGRLHPGYYADVVVFDPARYAAKATYAQPTLLSEGVVTVVVNGQLAVDGGQPTGVGAGVPLLRTPKAGSCG